MTDTKRMMAEFKNPGSDYRGAPFWAWNGKLDPAELRRQIRVMKEMGLGGFFMHSRVGLDTEYLSRDWFDCVNACIDEAEKQDMNAWLYDEDRWPSGAAGGLVTKNPRYRMRRLKIEVLKTAKGFKRTKDTLAVFTARLDGAAAYDVKQVPAGEKPAAAAGESILVFSVIVTKCSDWFNGQTYVDTMSREAVREYIRVTHEAYRKNCGRQLGRRVPGIFTDEPNRDDMMWVNPLEKGSTHLSWTPKLPEFFKKRYGYDLIPRLAELVFDVQGEPVSRARYHYHDCVTHLFVDAFSRQIGEWCERNKVQFTGHVLEEDTLASQVSKAGSCMRFYEHMQAPGMDLLTEHWRIFGTAKQVSSAARQFGRKWRLSETYGCTGWDFPFAGHKALGDWQVALGINLRCQHLSWYTMLAEAKRDYPAAIFYQSPWWRLYRKVEDYFARVISVMTRGTEVRDILVVHPVESMWVRCRAGWRQDEKTREADRDFVVLTETLLGAHLDFDFGDEELMSRHARITRKDGYAVLRVGKAEYKAVVVPPQITMRRTTLELLKNFKKADGHIVFAGDVAGYVDAAASGEVRDLAGVCERVEAQVVATAKSLEKYARRLTITDVGGNEITPALYLLREDKDNFYLFVCNTGEEFARSDRNIFGQGFVRDRRLAFADVRIRGFAGCGGAPVELDPENGLERATETRKWGEGWEIETSLPALGSRLYVVPKKTTRAGSAKPEMLTTGTRERLDGEGWEYRLSENNVMVLDRCRYKIGKGDLQKPMEILRVDCEVRKALGVPCRGGGMVQPWARPKPAKPRTIPVELVYEFEMEQPPFGELFLAVEKPQCFRITLNGARVDACTDAGWWTDLSLRKVPLDPMLLRPGKNEIRLETDYAENFSGLEIMYLLGLFGVTVKGTSVAMTALPVQLKVGDWCDQGLAFYAGDVAYCRRIHPRVTKDERVFVQVPEYRGVAVRVLVDGQSAGVIGWEPNEVEITDLLKGQPVELAIEVVGHRRNSHGPFHIKEKWPPWTGPGEYAYNPNRWFEGYQLVPCGLMQSPRIDIRSAKQG